MEDRGDIQSKLDEIYPQKRWLSVLQCFLPTGVADTKQIQKMTGLSRDQLNRFLATFREVAGESLVKRVSFSVPKPGVRGRAPVIYQLGAMGAELLRKSNYPKAHRSKLNTPIAVAHARAVLDVRLAAIEAGLDVETEIILNSSAPLRPDNTLILPSGTRLFYELEQAADMAILRRIVDSINRKDMFFSGDKGHAFSPVVRILFNLPRGAKWDRTIAVWEKAVGAVTRRKGKDLSFQMIAMPLMEFLQHPDWQDPPVPERWEQIVNPLKSNALAVPGKPTIPGALARTSSEDDKIILEAYWQHFQRVASNEEDTLRQPTPEFFELMKMIYAASNPISEAAVNSKLVKTSYTYPYASLYLLRKYLAIHKDLRDALSKEMSRGSGSMRWSVTLVLHRMQVVIATFMDYHGWKLGRWLQAYPTMPDRQIGNASFGIAVKIRPEILVEGDGVIPTFTEAGVAEEALAWILLALFRYGSKLGLRTPSFW